MNRNRLAICLLAVSLLAAARTDIAPVEPLIHSVTDISHEFTFYFDGRLAKNYLAGAGM